MTVDLSKARVWDVAHFRCGGTSQIVDINHGRGVKDADEKIFICFGGETNGYRINHCVDYWITGAANIKMSKKDTDSPFDIINLEPAPFNWMDVKPGMAFAFTEGSKTVVHFCGFDTYGRYLFHSRVDDVICRDFICQKMTRAPEYDIEVFHG